MAELATSQLQGAHFNLDPLTFRWSGQTEEEGQAPKPVAQVPATTKVLVSQQAKGQGSTASSSTCSTAAHDDAAAVYSEEEIPIEVKSSHFVSVGNVALQNFDPVLAILIFMLPTSVTCLQ